MSIPFFSTMLQSEFREKIEENVVIKEIIPDILDNLIDLSYGVEIKINSRNVERLMIGADFIQLNDVKSACESFLKTHLTPENVFNTKRVGEKLNCRQLVSTAEDYIDRNFVDFTKTDGFLELKKQALIEIIKRDEMRASEETIYEAVMKWIKYEEIERIALLPEILSYVRLCLLCPAYLSDVLSNEAMI